jgi:hypothetical protein
MFYYPFQKKFLERNISFEFFPRNKRNKMLKMYLNEYFP